MKITVVVQKIKKKQSLVYDKPYVLLNNIKMVKGSYESETPFLFEFTSKNWQIPPSLRAI